VSILFIGTPAFAVPSLRRLAAGDLTLTAVITQPDRPAGRGQHPRPSAIKVVAQELGIPILQPESLRDPQALAQLAALQPEVIVAVAYGQILRPQVLEIPPRGVLNVHPSLLPRWRGASPIPAAILAGDEQTGVTIMLMDAGMDSGPILAQRPIGIRPADTADTISERLSFLGADLIAGTLPRWLTGGIQPAPQDEALAVTSPLLRKEDGTIDWSMPAVDIWRRVRAYNPWPGAYTSLDNDMIRIWQAWPLEINAAAEPGAVLSLEPDQRGDLPEGVDQDAITVQTGSGLLAILRLQRAGRRVMSAGEFLRGMPGVLGRQFVSR
jgi:methionyl-tRNA formyltransferase